MPMQAFLIIVSIVGRMKILFVDILMRLLVQGGTKYEIVLGDTCGISAYATSTGG